MLLYRPIRPWPVVQRAGACASARQGEAYTLSVLYRISQGDLGHRKSASCLPWHPAQARVVDAALVTATGKVTAVDPSNRTLTVVGPSGEAVPL